MLSPQTKQKYLSLENVSQTWWKAKNTRLFILLNKPVFSLDFFILLEEYTGYLPKKLSTKIQVSMLAKAL